MLINLFRSFLKWNFLIQFIFILCFRSSAYFFFFHLRTFDVVAAVVLTDIFSNRDTESMINISFLFVRRRNDEKFMQCIQQLRKIHFISHQRENGYWNWRKIIEYIAKKIRRKISTFINFRENTNIYIQNTRHTHTN